jgi:hypothetical protein
MMNLRWTTIFVVFFAIATTASCEKGGNLEIELDVYSGKPNPKWELPPDEASSLLKTVESAPEEKAEMNLPGLGYRGFILRPGTKIIRVYHGLIAVEESGVTRTLRDKGNAEGKLAADARRRGYANLVADVPAVQ